MKKEPKPFAGAKLKIERAKRHISDYRAAFKALDHTDFIRVYTEANRNTGEIQLKVGKIDPLPDDLYTTSADAIYNLRSALDQVVSQCVVLSGKSPKNTYFPHGIDAAGFKASLHAKCKEVPKPVREAISALEPYYGGHGYLLQVLHDLNLIDKHTNLLAVTFRLEEGRIQYGNSHFPDGGHWQAHDGEIWQAKNNLDAEHVIMNADDKIKVACTITFSDVKIVKNEPVTKVLYQLCDAVERTVEIIEGRMTGLTNAKAAAEK